MGIKEAWNHVIAAVVQPGVEEKDAGCEEYDRERAKDLMASIKEYDQLVFEGHSTDYQTKYKLRELVRRWCWNLKSRSRIDICCNVKVFSLVLSKKNLPKV